MTPPSTAELVAAIRAELSDLLDAIRDADGQLFNDGARSALRHMQRTQALLKLIEERGEQ